MKDQKTKERFIELRAQGNSFDRISKDLDVSKPTLIQWSRELQLEIANSRELELEAIREKHLLSIEARMQIYRERLDAIRTAINQVDLATIPPDKLIALELKYLDLMSRFDPSVSLEIETNLSESLCKITRDTESWKA